MLDVRLMERVVAIPFGSQKIIGTLCYPESQNAPLMILLHGFTGTRDELAIEGTTEGVFSRMARVLADAGYASLRIDFRGSGDSEGAWEDTTFAGQVIDATAVIDWVLSQQEFTFSKLGVIGWSQGGYIAGCVAAERPELDCVALLAPTVYPRKTFTHLVGPRTSRQAETAEPDHLIFAEFPWGAKIQIKAQFFHELPEDIPPLGLSRFTNPMLVIAPLKDRVIFPQPAVSKVWLGHHLGAKKLEVLDCDHVFDVLKGPESFDQLLMPALLDWLGEVIAPECAQ